MSGIIVRCPLRNGLNLRHLALIKHGGNYCVTLGYDEFPIDIKFCEIPERELAQDVFNQILHAYRVAGFIGDVYHGQEA